ncbi:futalosine hydrolase [Peterkaempfera bronchialis]|uniref:futalosine hydrolase n=1 Tax=Peterkaempfera bronchialis TaxID=2126346 RepID=UPI00158CF886|nr:futalosine hydrolase [Peterkaempfera bronchialis]
MTATRTIRLLVVTAVAAERDAIAKGLGGTDSSLDAGPLRADLLAAGVGPAAAAAGAATELTAAGLRNDPYDLVITAGIGGGFLPLAPVGSLVVADAIVAADLGAESAEGFLPVETLGFGRSVHRPPQPLCAAVARALGAVRGPVLTVSTATGSAARARELSTRHPGAAAEAMEGFGVAEAAAAHGVPVLEIRAVSNAVGPRDRAAWRIGDALTALTAAFAELRDGACLDALERPEDRPEGRAGGRASDPR